MVLLRNILKKEKEVNKTTGSDKTKSCMTYVDNDSEKSSKASGSRGSSRQSSPAKEKPSKMKNDKAVESATAHRNSKAKISCENLEGKAVKKTEGKTPDKTEMSSKKIKKKETPVKTKKVVKNSSKKLPQHKGKSEDLRQSFNITEMTDNPSLPQNKKNKNSLPSKTSSSNSDSVALKDTIKKEMVGKEKKKGSQEQVAFESSDSTSVKSTVSHKKLVATKPSRENVEFDDSDELPLSVTKASVIETRKSIKKGAKDSKKSTTGSAKPAPRDFGTRKIRISYCNFDEVSRSKLEAFDHLFQELKKCPGYSKLTIANAVDMLTRIDNEQLKLIIKPKQSKNNKKKSSVSSSVTPKLTEQFSPPVKKKRSTSTSSEENTARKGASASTSKDKVRKSGSTNKQKTVAAQKRQEMNECQAAEALLNFKSKPAVSMSENTTGTSDTGNVSCQKEDVVETKTDKQSVLTSSLATESSVIGSLCYTTVLPVTSTSLAAETLLQIQTTAAQALLPSLPVTETTQSKMVQQTTCGVKSVTAHIPSSSTPQMDTSPIETSQDTAKSNKTDETTASITDQATKAMDSLAHIFDQNQWQFGGFPVQTVLSQNPNFSPITWAQTIPANIGQFSNVSTTLPSSICPLTPQAFSQLAPQAFTQMAPHVFGQVMPQAKQQLLTPAVQEVLTGTASAQPAFLPTAGQIGLGLQQANQATPMTITEAQPNQQAAQQKSQLPLKSMEEIVGNVGQTGVPQPVGWSFQKSQTPVVYLASPQTLGGVPRNIVPATQSTSSVPLGQENMYKPVSAKITTGKPELVPAAARISGTQGGTLSQGQTGLATVGKRPILPREQGATAVGLPETRATHRLPPVVPQVTNPIPASVQTPVSSSTLVPAQQRVVAASMTSFQSTTTPTTTLSAKQAVKNLVRERTKSAELKRQDSSGSTSSRSVDTTEPAEAGQRSPSLSPLQPRRVSESACDVTSIASTVDLTALQSASYQGTRPNEFNLEQAASALLSIGKTESPEGNTTSQGDDNQDGQDEKVVFTSKGMFRVGDVEVDPQYNRIGRGVCLYFL